jgi:hypothetical protein
MSEDLITTIAPTAPENIPLPQVQGVFNRFRNRLKSYELVGRKALALGVGCLALAACGGQETNPNVIDPGKQDVPEHVMNVADKWLEENPAAKKVIIENVGSAPELNVSGYAAKVETQVTLDDGRVVNSIGYGADTREGTSHGLNQLTRKGTAEIEATDSSLNAAEIAIDNPNQHRTSNSG